MSDSRSFSEKQEAIAEVIAQHCWCPYCHSSPDDPNAIADACDAVAALEAAGYRIVRHSAALAEDGRRHGDDVS